jgi:hypothetical protein
MASSTRMTSNFRLEQIVSLLATLAGVVRSATRYAS